MEGRCAVETWAALGCSTPRAVQLLNTGTDVLLCDGGAHVTVFGIQERKIKATLQFPGPVRDLIQYHDKQTIYATCEAGVYCVNLPFLMSRVPSSSANLASSPLVLEVSSDWLAIREQGVSSVLSVGSILLTLSQRDLLWHFTLYKVLAPVESRAGGHEKVVRLGLPVERDQCGRPEKKPVLSCVHAGEERTLSPCSPETPAGDGHFLLEPLLFKLLFGVDAALAKSPVFLCGLPDGRLCFFPLRPPPLQVRVLHSLQQPVVFVGVTAVTETGPSTPQRLVAAGGWGRVVTISSHRSPPGGGGGEVAGFVEGCVPGPVVCGRVDRQRFYYSTGSDLLALDLVEGAAREGKDAALGSPISLNVCGVVALDRPIPTAAGRVQLLGLSAKGRLQRITLPEGGEERGLPGLPSSQVGQRVKDLLAAIGDVCERAAVLKSSIQSKNQVLKRLNQVLNISCLLLSQRKTEGSLPVQNRPIRCRALAQWSTLLQRDSLNLSCTLENSSPYVLEQGWTLCVTVLPLSHSLTAGGENSSRTFSFPVRNLHPGQTFEVAAPLVAAGDTRFPVTVYCSLVMTLQSLLGQEDLASLLAGGDPVQSAGSDGDCFSLPVDTLTVDWLDALRVQTTSETSLPELIPADAIQAFLSARTVNQRRLGQGDSPGADGEQYSAHVRVSSELLGATLPLKEAPDAAPQVSKVAPGGLCVSVLEWLLPTRSGGDSTGPHQERSPVVCARCPAGCPVQLTAQEVTIGEKNDGGLKTVEILIESCSLAAVCGLHHAVLCRMQTLLQRAPEKAASTVSAQALGLRRALQRAESALRCIHESRVPEASGVGSTREQTDLSLFRVYRQLREDPLVIV